MSAQSLTAEDAALLYAESPPAQLQIGALCFFEAAPLRDRRGRLRLAALQSHIEARLGGLPRFRQRIAPVIGDLAAPMWVDDTAFDIRNHAKRVQLAAPGDTHALREFMDHLLGTPMDFAHPLWDIHVVDGLASDAGAPEIVAVVVRAHHVMADGIALHAAATLLLDAEPRAPRNRTGTWTAEPTPGALNLAASSLIERSRRQLGLTLDVGRGLVDPRHFAANARLGAHLVASVGKSRSSMAPALPFTRSVGSRRAFSWDSIPMADIIAIKHACGATVNDVVLGIAAGALRAAMEADGSFDSAAPEPRALVPIGGTGSADAASGNRFSIINVALPVAIDNPLDRVRAAHHRMHPPPQLAGPSLMPHLFSVADIVPPPVLRALVPRLLARQPFVNLAVSNIPGSRAPLFLWESEMLGLHPFINVVGNVALIVGVLSYRDALGVGVTVDPDVVGDPDRIVGGIRAAAAELAALAR